MLVTGIRTHVPTCQKVARLPTELPGRPDYTVHLYCCLDKQNLIVV